MIVLLEEIRQIALELYDLSGDFKPLKSERDQNYHIQTKSGENYVLKLSNQDEDPGVIDFIFIKTYWTMQNGLPPCYQTIYPSAFLLIQAVRQMTLPGKCLNSSPAKKVHW